MQVANLIFKKEFYTTRFFRCLYLSFFLFGIMGCWHQNEVAIDELEVVSVNNIFHYQMDSVPYAGLVFRDSLSIRLEEFTVASGNRNGQYILYHPNGQIKVKSLYLNGILNGVEERFLKDGIRSALSNFSQGKRSGNQYLFYPSGTIKEVLFFDDGVIKGENVFYFKDGKIRQRVHFNQLGQRSGSWTKFYSNGVLKEKIEYSEGQIVSPLRRYDINGQLIP